MQAKLNTGRTIPNLGFGTFLIKPLQTQQAVSAALKLGYRHIDTAQLYGNEREVGRALRNSGLEREEVFVTTKLWESEWGYRKASGAIQDRLAELDMEYIDLLLLHTPGNPQLRAETWKALESAFSQGHLRAIGVSNFGVGHLEKLAATTEVLPAVNQIELTPFLQRKKLVDYCKSHDILLEAYSPLCKGSTSKMGRAEVVKIAEQLGVTPAQVLLRWSIQRGFVPLPKTANPGRMAENLDVYGFQLDTENMRVLDSLEENFVTAWDPSEDAPV